MMKKSMLFMILSAFVLFGCNLGSGEKTAEAVLISVLNFEKSAPANVDKAVVIEGTVLHTCKHSGKRMFLVDGSDSIRVEITAGKNIAKFDEKLVGSRVKVYGTLKEDRIDEKYLSEWENEVKKPAENHEAGVHTGAIGHEDQSANDKLDQINAYREQIKASGTDHLSFYSIEADKFEEIKL
jgi:hypothetical protein